MAIDVPSKLYRFRWLSPDTFAREIAALENSYLFAPPFLAMNDPMEAFYETGGPGDRIVSAMLSTSGKSVQGMYKMVDEMIAKFALVSFTGTYEALPLWAYYANNFSGMCLEFDTDQLFIGDFQGERLRSVTYARNALPPINTNDFGPGIEDAVIARITRKRVEWAHEKEWRFVTGSTGPKHYLDDALERVFLGPRIDERHAETICRVLANRPVEVLQGRIRGFELEFTTRQSAKPLAECDRVGAGKFEPAEHLYAEAELRQFFGPRYGELVAECERTVSRPNAVEPVGIDVSKYLGGAVYFHTEYALRNGRSVYHKRYFDREMHLLDTNL